MPRKATSGSFKPGDPRAGRPKGSLSQQTIEAREFCRSVITDPTYQANLRKRYATGKLAPAVETMIWGYAYGKPKEQVEVTGAEGGPLAITQIARIIIRADRDPSD